MPITKDQKSPAILLTRQNYSENDRSPARTENLLQDGSPITISASLLLVLNSLFPKIFSLIRDLKFPVNFEAQITRTPCIAPNRTGIHVYG